jgi:hypothetical protein
MMMQDTVAEVRLIEVAVGRGPASKNVRGQRGDVVVVDELHRDLIMTISTSVLKMEEMLWMLDYAAPS